MVVPNRHVASLSALDAVTRLVAHRRHHAVRVAQRLDAVDATGAGDHDLQLDRVEPELERFADLLPSLLSLALPVPHTGIKSAGSQKPGVGSALGNAPLIQHDDLVGANDGGEPMRNDQRGAVARDALVLFVPSVESHSSHPQTEGKVID